MCHGMPIRRQFKFAALKCSGDNIPSPTFRRTAIAASLYLKGVHAAIKGPGSC